MKLYCMRHGEAENPGVNPKRPLTEKGRLALHRLGAHLKNQSLVIPNIVHSPVLRAVQTAEIMAEYVSPTRVTESRYQFDHISCLEPTLDMISESDEDLLIVGHLPFMSELVSELTTGKTHFPLLQFLPGTIVCLERYCQPVWLIDWVLNAAVLK